MNTPRSLITLTAIAWLAACTTEPDAEPEAGEQMAASEATQDEETDPAEPDESVSILREGIDQPEPSAPPLQPLTVILPFPEGGTELGASALIGLQDVLASPQIALGGPIVLGGHTDTAGGDGANLRASRARAERVRTWLVENGVAEDRIRIVAFGEQNPIEPNALPDGTPNEAGRARNRRVEIAIAPTDEAQDVQDEREAETNNADDPEGTNS